MRNRIINLGVVAEIAQALGDLNESVVFVGGAVISIYADDPAADEVRPTQDVDLTLKLLDFSQRELDAKLAERGFHPDIQGHAICTYKYNDIAVDIMASTDSMRGPANRWYSIGFDEDWRSGGFHSRGWRRAVRHRHQTQPEAGQNPDRTRNMGRTLFYAVYCHQQ